jgi:hypothetical protein
MQKYGYLGPNIRLLTDTGMKPTLQAIRAGITWLLSGARAGDTLFFYYSGHGTNTLDRSRDESDGMDEMLVPLDYVRNGCISDDWLFTNFLSRVPRSVRTWVFMDCCHSGTMCDLRYNVSYTPTRLAEGTDYVATEWGSAYQFTQEGSKETAGSVFCFSGATDPQTAADASFQGKANGSFTVAVLQSLRQTTAPSIKDLLKELNCRLVLLGFPEQNSQLTVGRLGDLEQKCSF